MNLWRIRIEEDSGEVRGSAEPARWLSDGRRLLFRTFATTSTSDLYLLDSFSRKTREILPVTPSTIGEISLSRDGRRIYFALHTVESDVWLMCRE